VQWATLLERRRRASLHSHRHERRPNSIVVEGTEVNMLPSLEDPRRECEWWKRPRREAHLAGGAAGRAGGQAAGVGGEGSNKLYSSTYLQDRAQAAAAKAAAAQAQQAAAAQAQQRLAQQLAQQQLTQQLAQQRAQQRVPQEHPYAAAERAREPELQRMRDGLATLVRQVFTATYRTRPQTPCMINMITRPPSIGIKLPTN